MLRVPGAAQSQQMPQPDMGMNNMGMPPQDGGGEVPQDGMDNMNNMPPQDGQDMGNSNDSEFDTNFDAGVEADEDADPQKYIQQLTGKLSTKLLSYNGQDSDPSLNKYVGKMILKQVVKGLDEKSKKELIGIINSSDSQNELPDDDELVDDTGEDDKMNV